MGESRDLREGYALLYTSERGGFVGKVVAEEGKTIAAANGTIAITDAFTFTHFEAQPNPQARIFGHAVRPIGNRGYLASDAVTVYRHSLVRPPVHFHELHASDVRTWSMALAEGDKIRSDLYAEAHGGLTIASSMPSIPSMPRVAGRQP